MVADIVLGDMCVVVSIVTMLVMVVMVMVGVCVWV
jgi:hypothetical protein